MELWGVNINDLGAGANVGATFVAFLALCSALYTARMQHKHNKLSVRPLVEVEFMDMNNHILVKLCNNGVGPLVVKDFYIARDGVKVAESLVMCLPKQQKNWTFFVGPINGRSVRPNGELRLIELEYDPFEQSQRDVANLIRRELAKLVVEIKYENIYNDEMPAYSKSLEWFGRLQEGK